MQDDDLHDLVSRTIQELSTTNQSLPDHALRVLQSCLNEHDISQFLPVLLVCVYRYPSVYLLLEETILQVHISPKSSSNVIDGFINHLRGIKETLKGGPFVQISLKGCEIIYESGGNDGWLSRTYDILKRIVDDVPWSISIQQAILLNEIVKDMHGNALVDIRKWLKAAWPLMIGSDLIVEVNPNAGSHHHRNVTFWQVIDICSIKDMETLELLQGYLYVEEDVVEYDRFKLFKELLMMVERVFGSTQCEVYLFVIFHKSTSYSTLSTLHMVEIDMWLIGIVGRLKDISEVDDISILLIYLHQWEFDRAQQEIQQLYCLILRSIGFDVIAPNILPDFQHIRAKFTVPRVNCALLYGLQPFEGPFNSLYKMFQSSFSMYKPKDPKSIQEFLSYLSVALEYVESSRRETLSRVVLLMILEYTSEDQLHSIEALLKISKHTQVPLSILPLALKTHLSAAYIKCLLDGGEEWNLVLKLLKDKRDMEMIKVLVELVDCYSPKVSMVGRDSFQLILEFLISDLSVVEKAMVLESVLGKIWLDYYFQEAVEISVLGGGAEEVCRLYGMSLAVFLEEGLKYSIPLLVSREIGGGEVKDLIRFSSDIISTLLLQGLPFDYYIKITGLESTPLDTLLKANLMNLIFNVLGSEINLDYLCTHVQDVTEFIHFNILGFISLLQQKLESPKESLFKKFELLKSLTIFIARFSVTCNHLIGLLEPFLVGKDAEMYSVALDCIDTFTLKMDSNLNFEVSLLLLASYDTPSNRVMRILKRIKCKNLILNPLLDQLPEAPLLTTLDAANKMLVDKNNLIVLNGMAILHYSLSKHQDLLMSYGREEEYPPILQTTLSLMIRMMEGKRDDLVMECICLIGPIDPLKVTSTYRLDTLIEVQNTQEGLLDYTCKLIKNCLLPLLEGAKGKATVAYVIQELLLHFKFNGMKKMEERWNFMSDGTTLLSPLLCTTYEMEALKAKGFPTFRGSYSKFIRALAVELCLRSNLTIFRILSHLFEDDLSISLTLLPSLLSHCYRDSGLKYELKYVLEEALKVGCEMLRVSVFEVLDMAGIGLIDLDLLYKVALECKYYSRALLYLECKVTISQAEREELYELLECRDSLESIVKSGVRLDKVCGRWTEVMSYYQSIGEEKGYLESLKGMAHYSAILKMTENSLTEVRVGALWRLSEFTLPLEKINLKGTISERDLYETLKVVKDEGTPDSLTSKLQFNSSYEHSYKSISKLVLLNDISQFKNPKSDEDYRRLRVKWTGRLDCMAPNQRQECLVVYRVLATFIKNDTMKDSMREELWVRSAKEARKISHFQFAHSAISHTKSGAGQVEYCKLLYAMDEKSKAISMLEDLEKDDHLTLLLTRWKDDTGSVSSSKVAELYSLHYQNVETQEKAYYLLGRHYHRMMNSYQYSKHLSLSSLALSVCKFYMRSLVRGDKYLYQTLPKTLSLWFKMGMGEEGFSVKDSAKVAEHYQTTTNFLRKVVPKVSAFKFYTALPQILTRIGHPNILVQEILISILTAVLKRYPRETIWYLIPHLDNPLVKSVIKNVVMDKKILELIMNQKSISKHLITICNHKGNKSTQSLSISKHFPILKNVAGGTLVPLESTLSCNSKTAFADPPITIVSFNDHIVILQSLQRPKKVSLLASNGINYNFLCKPDDDLRKDARVMEFNGIVNKLLKKDRECRKRAIKVRTYVVVPLDLKCGLIQWINHMKSLRQILISAYKDSGIAKANSTAVIKELIGNTKKTKLQIFEEDILPLHPPVLHKWFMAKFPRPDKWLENRTQFTTTVAAMSMIGYILGLGDRHGENIIVDLESGECLHVDLSCLFEAGKTFEVAEVVPFRLTRNMIVAFGLCGTQGPFLKSCQATMSVLRSNNELLNSVLETFLYDPLWEWSKGSSMKNTGKASQCLETIDRKLNGLNDQSSHLAVSVEAQAIELIDEASSNANLSLMYLGWNAFM